MQLGNRLIITSTLLLMACGDTGGGDGVDARPNVDAPPGGGPCMIADNLGTISAAQQPSGISMGGTPADPDAVEVRAPFNLEGFNTDWFAIRLWKGTTAFPTTIAPGTFDLTGPELDYSTCGACVMLVGDHTGDRAEEETHTYMATAGVITISTVTPSFSASLSNATFRHIAFDPAGNQLPNQSGCTASVDSLTVTATIQQFLTGDSRAMPQTGWPGSARVQSLDSRE